MRISDWSSDVCSSDLRPRVCRNIERDRCEHIGERRLGQPRTDAVVMLAALGGLPLQMRQRGAEMDGVLTRAAADFENVSAIGEMRVQHFENRIAIAITDRKSTRLNSSH